MTNRQPENQPIILIVDDEQVTLQVIATMIKAAGIGRPLLCQDPRLALSMALEQSVSLVLLDLHMPYRSGEELLNDFANDCPHVPAIVLTNQDTIETAVLCMKRGAFDFLTKPIDQNRLMSAIRNALTVSDLRREVTVLSAPEGALIQLRNPEYFEQILTCSSRMKAIFAYVEAIAQSPRAVLVTGESGTGKELFARVIHRASRRRGAFVPVNVAGLDDTVFSDSLFGHLRGSYTGADSSRSGLVQQAKDGTLFLDEIGDLEPGPQIKLLRLLQEGEYYQIGSDTQSLSQARIIVATNADLVTKQETGLFRKDLYYRLLSHRIDVPPLRNRLEDIPLLVAHFVAESAVDLQREPVTAHPAVLKMLQSYHFPGNIRELQALVHDALSRCVGPQLLVKDFRFPWLTAQVVAQIDNQSPNAVDNGPADSVNRQVLIPGPADLWLGETLPRIDQTNDFLIQVALARANNNQVKAASWLGISQPTLSRWLQKNHDQKINS